MNQHFFSLCLCVTLHKNWRSFTVYKLVTFSWRCALVYVLCTFYDLFNIRKTNETVKTELKEAERLERAAELKMNSHSPFFILHSVT